jgi:hypothetical protein
MYHYMTHPSKSVLRMNYVLYHADKYIIVQIDETLSQNRLLALESYIKSIQSSEGKMATQVLHPQEVFGL